MTLLGVHKLDKPKTWMKRESKAGERGREGGLKALCGTELLVLCPKGERGVALRAVRPMAGSPPKGVFTAMPHGGFAFEGSFLNTPLIKAVMAGCLQG